MAKIPHISWMVEEEIEEKLGGRRKKRMEKGREEGGREEKRGWNFLPLNHS